MRESRPYGSVRGALSNERPYRDFSFLPAWISFPRFAQKDSGPTELDEQ